MSRVCVDIYSSAFVVLLSFLRTFLAYLDPFGFRGWHFFEMLNANEVFGEIMIDYDDVECTSSALQALCLFREMYPGHRRSEVDAAIKAATKFMLSIQLPELVDMSPLAS